MTLGISEREQLIMTLYIYWEGDQKNLHREGDSINSPLNWILGYLYSFAKKSRTFKKKKDKKDNNLSKCWEANISMLDFE